MISRSESLVKLYEWRNRHYFSTDAWEERGLIKSPDPIPFLLDRAKNSLIDDLLKAVYSNADEESMIRKTLEHFSGEMEGGRFDTEEREFLGDCIFQIADSLELKSFGTRFYEWMEER